MSERSSIGPAGLAALVATGAIGGLIGDMGHVQSGTTVYLEDPLPYIWESQLWFPLMVGGGTAALGWIAVELGASAAEAERSEPLREAAAAIASVLGLYALTAIVRGEPAAVGIVLCYSVAALICARFARDRVDWLCALLAALFGVGSEVLLSAAGVFEYAGDVEQILGVAAWLPALYLAYGVVASRLGVLVALSRGPR
ncbi:MAG: hypothetical protein M3Q53_01530 [Actinomycetota bacterium]|nr:hypothetical protein [Actinomycetota bacterium]